MGSPLSKEIAAARKQETLNLSQHSLHDLPGKEIAKSAKKLVNLDLSQNSLTEIPPELSMRLL